ncbi:ATP-binding protein [Acidisphaera sp. L21]|uniref:ATP-binding protein n=1 Tax=Acidisphaera sp. L21 TaxID=1641851 RepID=UPI0020B13B39|nr:ATP-binding protein [Acidisphaera sp. L21]
MLIAVNRIEETGPHTGAADLQLRLLSDEMISADLYGGAVIDASGRVIEATETYPVPLGYSLANRTYFKAQQSGHGVGLFVSGPIVSSGYRVPVVELSRRIEDPVDVSFAGVVAIGLKMSYFQKLFAPLDLGEDGVVSFVTTDGYLLERFPHDDQNFGRDLRPALLFEHLAASSDGGYEGISPVDGVFRYYSYRRIGKLPLVVSVGFSTREMFARSNLKAAYIGAACLLFVSVCAALGCKTWLELRRRLNAETAAAGLAHLRADADAQLAVLFNNSADAMAISSVMPDGSFTCDAINPTWTGMLGVQLTDVTGKPPEAYLPPEVVPAVDAAYRECIATGRVVPYRYKTPSDGREWESSVAPIVGEDGRVRKLVAVAKDMTDRDIVEAGVRQTSRMEAVGQLSAGVAHDFNNMLQSMMAALEILRDQDGLTSQGRECVTLAEDAGHRGATLVQQLLAFARKQALAADILRPQDVLAEITPLLAHAMGSAITIRTQIGDVIPTVRADGTQLGNCLFNLAINARDAMPGGGTLTLRACGIPALDAASAGFPEVEHMRFDVEDDGEGMSPETVTRAMEPFFTTKVIGKGTGLGLSSALGFARQSGGDIRIRSVVGEGTTVSLWLPCATGETIVLQEEIGYRHPAGERGRGRVLVVEDQEGIGRTLCFFLKKAGYAFSQASSGEEALGMLAAGESFDLLVTDQTMPGMTGDKLIGEVSRLQAHMPTMLITGAATLPGFDDNHGQVTVLRKPFLREAFLEQVQALLPDATQKSGSAAG